MAKIQKKEFGRNIFFSWCQRLMCSGGMRLFLWVIAIVILCIIFWLVYPGNRRKSIKNAEQENNKNSRSFDLSILKLAPGISGCTFNVCDVYCSNSDDLTDQIFDAVTASPCSLINVLHIEQQQFPNNTLGENWIYTEKRFTEIVIAYSNLSNIHNEAFNVDDFAQTIKLSLIALPIKSLSAGSLLGLSQLEILTIECELEDINRGFFQPVSSSVRKLKMSLMKETIVFDFLFGIAQMTNLIHLDLSNNNFIDPITRRGFYPFPKVNYINLSRSKITTIQEDAFRPIKDTLRYLDLTHNELVTLNPDVLQSVLVEMKSYIMLGDNPWHCDCNLNPLIQTYFKYSKLFLDISIASYCKSPLEYYGYSIVSIPFLCDNEENVTNTTEPHLPTSIEDFTHGFTSNLITSYPSRSSEENENEGSTGVTYPDPKYFKLACFNDSSSNDSNTESNGVDFFYFLPPHHEFYITLLHNNSAQITINKYRGRLTILWYSDPDDYQVVEHYISDYGCRVPQNDIVVIENLKDNVTYTFCLIPEGKTKITPFNCLPYHVPISKHADNIWIEKSDRELAVAVATIILLISFCIGAAAGYLILRNFPDLLKGSKHVLIVEKVKDTGINTISHQADSRKSCFNIKQKKITPPPCYNFALDNESSYESPIEVDDCEFTRRSSNTLKRYEVMERLPNSPPPLPKRNSEPTYSSVVLARLKSGII